MLPVSLDCPCLIVPSVFSNVYLPVSLDCPCFIAPSVFSNVYLPVSLDCPCLIVPSVFSNVYQLTFSLIDRKHELLSLLLESSSLPFHNHHIYCKYFNSILPQFSSSQICIFRNFDYLFFVIVCWLLVCLFVCLFNPWV